MFILTSLTLPLAAFTAFSRIGVNCLQGPHHGAQKSTSTGWRRDSSITSLRKFWVVTSLTRPSVAADAIPTSINVDLSLDRTRHVHQRLRIHSGRRAQSQLQG